MRFVGRGHPAIRATHHKTLELTADAEVTERGTCIVAVAAEAAPPAPCAGPVRIRISAGGVRFALDAVANSSWDPAGPMVIRRSALALPGTFATGASAAASDLPRELVAALQDPDALVTVDVAPRPDGVATVVLFAADPSRPDDPRLAAEQERADTVVAQDGDARRLVDGRSADSSTIGPRTLVVATRELPGTGGLSGTGGLLAAAQRFETVGLTPQLAAAAAMPARGPLLLAPRDADPRVLLRRTPAAYRLVLTSDVRGLDGLLSLAAEHRGGAVTVAQPFRHPSRVIGGVLPELSSGDDVHCCFGPGTAGEPIDQLDPAVRAAIDALLGDGVATRSAAKALAALTGWDRRRAYAAVLDWTT